METTSDDRQTQVAIALLLSKNQSNNTKLHKDKLQLLDNHHDTP